MFQRKTHGVRSVPRDVRRRPPFCDAELLVWTRGGENVAKHRPDPNLPDVARQLPWPPGFTARIRRNAFTERWTGAGPRFAASSEPRGVLGITYGSFFNPGPPLEDRLGLFQAFFFEAKF